MCLAVHRTSSGDHTVEETPVPIPNTAVKLSGPMIVPTSAKVGIARFYSQKPRVSSKDSRGVFACADAFLTHPKLGARSASKVVVSTAMNQNDGGREEYSLIANILYCSPGRDLAPTRGPLGLIVFRDALP